ncbi:amidohydrolase family protein [Amycolatopsis jejuensis]|uniref:amidohydrolase family protein n=1 Tax=Amycolatopsis jejuensis TaxID=330084 RepID=UPI00068E50ED|nr:amidohydrolase family protein [Amycolatopsis jejuensis]
MTDRAVIRHAAGAVRIADGVIVSAGPEPAARPGEQVHDLTGYLLLPAPAEPHVHLDKALLAGRIPNPAGDLTGAIGASRRAYRTMTADDVAERAGRALREAAANGCTAVRSHVNCTSGIGTTALRALAEVRRTAPVTVQLVALAGFPFTGHALHRRLLLDAIEAGADVVGGVPALDPDPPRAVHELARIAADHHLPLDLHLDETTDPAVLTLREFASAVREHALEGRATASHCVSLGQQDASARAEVAHLLADAGIAVVVLPQTNLGLQGRNAPGPIPRGLTAVAELLAAGVPVAAGGDNWRDMFNPLGRIDPLETAALMVAAAHLTPAQAYHAVSAASRRVMGLPEVRLAPGYPADLLAIAASSPEEAVAAASPQRVVWRAGRRIAATRLVRDEMHWTDMRLPTGNLEPPPRPAAGRPGSAGRG